MGDTVPLAVMLRALRPADRDAYRELRLRALREEPEAFTSSYEEQAASTADWASARLATATDANLILGAFDAGGRLVGMVGLERQPRRKERHKAHLYGMYVAPEVAGRGIGGQLVAAAVAAARRWIGVRQITLSVTRTNVRARRLYETAGFATFGIEPEAIRVDQAFLDKELMVLRLT